MVKEKQTGNTLAAEPLSSRKQVLCDKNHEKVW